MDWSVGCSAGDWIGWLVDIITIANMDIILRDLGVHNAKESAHRPTDYETKYTVKKQFTLMDSYNIN